MMEKSIRYGAFCLPPLRIGVSHDNVLIFDNSKYFGNQDLMENPDSGELPFQKSGISTKIYYIKFWEPRKHLDDLKIWNIQYQQGCADGCMWRGIAPPLQYFQICKKVGQKSAMLQERVGHRIFCHLFLPKRPPQQKVSQHITEYQIIWSIL